MATTRELDKHDLYELCVTDGDRLARFFRAVHGRKPKMLREDFSGTAALARAWAASGGGAVAVDLDPTVLARVGEGVRAVRADASKCRAKADVVAATNFPLGYFHDRKSLVAYLRGVRASLNARGVFAADLYGGRDAFRTMKLVRKLKGPGGEQVAYTWEQRAADPMTGFVLDTLSFEVRAGNRTRRLPDAFVYRWRLWSIPELTDALHDAGFRRTEIYTRLGDAIDSDGNLYVMPTEPGEELDENYVVYVVGRR